MNFFQKIFSLIIFSIYFSKGSLITLKKNIYQRIDLNSEITELIISPESSKYINLELIFSLQSNYIITFNHYKEDQNLYSYYNKNQTGLIKAEAEKFGKNIIILNNGNNINKVIISIVASEIKFNNNFVYIKYSFSDINFENEFEKIMKNQDSYINKVNAETIISEKSIEETEDNSSSDGSDEDKGSNKKDENGEIDVEKNRENNKLLLFIITGGFVGIVFLTFIIFFIFIKCCNKETGELIEEEKDYSNIGGIVSGKSEDVSGISDEG